MKTKDSGQVGMRYRFIVNYFYFIALNILSISDIITMIVVEDNLLVLTSFLSHILIVTTVQFLLIITISYIKIINRNTQNIYLYLSTFALAGNIFVLKFVNYDATFNILGTYLYQIIAFIFLYTLLLVIFLVFKKKTILLFIVVSMAMPMNKLYEINFVHSIENHNVKVYPKFQQKPNVYLLGWDALAPFSIINKQINTNLKFDPIISNNKLSFRNAMGFGNTKFTWNSILTLGFLDDIYDETVMTRPYPHPQHNLLVDIFISNGYELATNLPGAIDEEEKKETNGSIKNSMLCLEKPHILFMPKFYNFCSSATYSLYERILKNVGAMQFARKSKESDLMSMYKQIDKTKQPRLNIFHEIYTAHTPRDFDYNQKSHVIDFKNFYGEKFITVNDWIKKIYISILEKDPSSIIIIFGDHGIWYYKNNYIDFEKNHREYFLDRFPNQIFLLKTRNECSKINLRFNNRKYTFHHSVLIGLIDCLTKNDYYFNDRFFEKSIHGKEMPVLEGFKYRNLDDYLYE